MKDSTKEWWKQWGRNIWGIRSELLRGLATIVGMSIAVNTIRARGPALYSAIAHEIGPHRTQLIIGVLVLCIGIAAHLFKRRSHRWYGIVEVIFGVVSGFSISFNLSPDKPWLPQGATLVGCAYVIARGMNNVHDANQKALAVAKAWAKKLELQVPLG